VDNTSAVAKVVKGRLLTL